MKRLHGAAMVFEKSPSVSIHEFAYNLETSKANLFSHDVLQSLISDSTREIEPLDYYVVTISANGNANYNSIVRAFDTSMKGIFTGCEISFT